MTLQQWPSVQLIETCCWWALSEQSHTGKVQNFEFISYSVDEGYSQKEIKLKEACFDGVFGENLNLSNQLLKFLVIEEISASCCRGDLGKVCVKY